MQCTLTDEVTGAAERLGSVDAAGVSVRHVQLSCDRVRGQVVPVSRVVAVERDRPYVTY